MSLLTDASKYPSLQAAIDAAESFVYVPAGIYNISQTIQCRSGIDIKLARQAVIKAGADVDLFRLVPNMKFYGGKIDTSLPSYTKSAFLLDGRDRFSFTDPLLLSEIRMLGNGKGTAIRFQSKQQANIFSYIFGVTIQNFSVSNFENGVWMETSETPQETKWAAVNGNHIGSGVFDRCVYSVRLNRVETGVNDLLGIGGNQFSDIQIQAGETSRRGVYCEGWHNQFSNIMVWDWQLGAEPYGVEFPARSKRNIMTTGLYSWFLSNAGEQNNIITPDSL